MAKRDPEVIKSYREQIHGCEVCPIPWFKFDTGTWSQYGLNCLDDKRDGWQGEPQVHHIIGGHSRFDHEANLISVCGWFHTWNHDRDPVAGRVVALKAKSDRGKLDPFALSELWGQSVIGWLEQDKVAERCQRHEALEVYRTDLINECYRMAGMRRSS